MCLCTYRERTVDMHESKRVATSTHRAKDVSLQGYFVCAATRNAVPVTHPLARGLQKDDSLTLG